MSFFAWVGLYLLALSVFATAETVEIRIVKTSKLISAAINSNLDTGKITTEHFEKVYDSLVSKKEIEELARFAKTDATNNSNFKFESTGPKNHGRVFIALDPHFSETNCQMAFAVNVYLPTGRSTTEPPSLDTFSSALLRYDKWQALSEINSGDARVICLAKVSSQAPQIMPDKSHPLIFEGYLIPMSEVEAANAIRLAQKELDTFANKESTKSHPIEYVRYSLQPSTAGRVMKSLHDEHGFKGVDPILVAIEASAHLSPDAKWVHMITQATIDRPDNTSNSHTYAHAYEDTIPIGHWKAIPAARHPTNQSSLLLVRIIDQQPLGNAAGTDTPTLKPMPESGTLTRIYPDIHPRVIRDLAPGVSPPLLKDLLIANGIPDGQWSAVMLPNNQVMIGSADVAVHRMIESLLKRYTWTEEISKKSAPAQ